MAKTVLLIGPNKRVADRFRLKIPTRAPEGSAAIATYPIASRNVAFFSATISDLNLLGKMKSEIEDALTLPPEKAFTDKAHFIARMRNAMGADPGDTGKITDISSNSRLGLIYDTQVEQAYSQARWETANSDPAILDAFPAQELVRVEAREKERDWPAKWRDAGGELFAGRMIARKDSPVWAAISRFGNPYPPFDYGSGMGVRDIARSEAIRLGVIDPDTHVAPTKKQHEYDVKQSAKNIPKDVLDRLSENFREVVKLKPTADGQVEITAIRPDQVIQKAWKEKETKELLSAVPTLPDGETIQEYIAQHPFATDSNGNTYEADFLGHFENRRGMEAKDRSTREQFVPAAYSAIATDLYPKLEKDSDGKDILNYRQTWEKDGKLYTIRATIDPKTKRFFNYFAEAIRKAAQEGGPS